MAARLASRSIAKSRPGGGGDVGVPEPPADRHQIDLRLQEVGGGGVLQHMRVQALGGEGRDGGGRHVRVLA